MPNLRFSLAIVLLLVSGITPAKAPAVDISPTLAEQIVKQQKGLDELKALQEDLIKTANAKTVAIEQTAIFKNIETDRKSIDWWFAALAIMTTVVGFLGALVPYFLIRKDREILQAERKLDRETAQRDKLLIESELKTARDLVASINEKKVEAEQSAALLKSFTSGSKTESDAGNIKNSEIAAQVKEVTDNPKRFSAVDKLRARAVNASQIESPTIEQAQQAYKLWEALTVINDQDASALFNAGYWAQELAEQTVTTDPAAALALLRSAGEKYDLALRIKPDLHEAASNWGFALLLAGDALSKTDKPAAQALWKQAEALLEQHAQAAPVQMSFNLACVYSLLGKLDAALTQLELRRAGNELPDHWREDADLLALRATPEYQAWCKKHFPNG